MAMPTPTPTRWPTPASARDREVPIIVAPAPTRKTPEMSTLMALRALRKYRAAEAMEPRTMTPSPRLDSSAPSLVSPTRRTSAPATPSG